MDWIETRHCTKWIYSHFPSALEMGYTDLCNETDPDLRSQMSRDLYPMENNKKSMQVALQYNQ